MKNERARDIIAAARVKVCGNDSHPYFAPVLMSLRLVEREGFGTMGVDKGWRCYYDPEVIEQWGVSGTAAVCVHEVGHLIRKHHERFPPESHDQMLANLAGDLAINDDVVAAGWKFPEMVAEIDGKKHQAQVLLPGTFGLEEGEAEEHYYNALLKMAKKVKIAAAGVPGAGGKCGGCSGNPHDFEGDGKGEGSGEGGGDDGEIPEPISGAEQEVLIQQTAQQITEHAKNRGTVPAGLLKWAETQLEPPRVDWRKVLARHVRSAAAEIAGQVNFSYRRPSRRLGAMTRVWPNPPILPSMRRPIVQCSVVLDTSGSMGDMEHGDLRTACAEVLGVVQNCGMPCTVYGVDADVAAITKVATARDLERVVMGGGGTDMRVGISKAFSDGAKLVIVLTDGYTPWPELSEMRGRHLVAAVTPGGAEPPEHIDHVMIPEA